MIDSNGGFAGADIIILPDEHSPAIMYHPFEAGKSLQIENYNKESLLQKVMENGKRTAPVPALHDITGYARHRFELLPEEYKRFENPHMYKVGISKKLLDLKEQLRRVHKNQ